MILATENVYATQGFSGVNSTLLVAESRIQCFHKFTEAQLDEVRSLLADFNAKVEALIETSKV